MSAGAASAIQPTQISHQDKVITGLLDTQELGYSNYLLNKSSFSTAGRWNTLSNNLADDLSVGCTLQSLESVVDRVIISADHSYQVVRMSLSEAKNIRYAIKKVDVNSYKSIYRDNYPMKTEFFSGVVYQVGEDLCKITDMGDGLACIFSSVLKIKRNSNSPSEYLQSFHTVFIPHKSERLEIRISNKIPASQINSSFEKVEREFINVVGQYLRVGTLRSVNSFKAIASLFDDKTEGRVQYAMMTTNEDGDDADLNGRARKDYCARKVEVSDQVHKHKYICRYLRIRYGYGNNIDMETELSLTPHKRDWENDECLYFGIKHPKSALFQSIMVDKVLSRS
ncbi:hypothetical protein WNY79_10840 [Pseudoalteromonas sp. AS84]|uniref:hypothetical protein n=1 Tax=Pseudoalteromonas sp. AS84 TaxID=3135778 RepID=UPI003177B5F3